MGRIWVFFLSHTAPGFQLWFCFHLYTWVVPWGLLPRLPWRAWVCPVRAGVELGQLLGSQGFWQHQVLRGVGGSGSRKYGVLEGHGNQYRPICSSVLAWRTRSLTEKPGRPQSTGWQRVRQDRSDPARINTRPSQPAAALPRES